MPGFWSENHCKQSRGLNTSQVCEVKQVGGEVRCKTGTVGDFKFDYLQ